MALRIAKGVNRHDQKYHYKMNIHKRLLILFMNKFVFSITKFQQVLVHTQIRKKITWRRKLVDREDQQTCLPLVNFKVNHQHASHREGGGKWQGDGLRVIQTNFW